VAGEFQEFFTELLYGTGSWLGLTLIVILFFAMLVKWKYAGVLFLPITISVFMLFYMIKELRK